MERLDFNELTFGFANAEYRKGNYAGAVSLYDQLASKMPRNHFARLNAIMSCIADRKFDEASLRLAKIDNSLMLGEDLIGSVQKFLQGKIERHGVRLPVTFPANYYCDQRRNGYSPQINRISLTRKSPSGFPFELVLPTLEGEGNDFSFIERAVNLASPSDENTRLNVIIVGEVPANVNRLISLLRSQKYPQEHVSLTVVCSSGSGIRIADKNVKLRVVNAETVSLKDINSFLSESDGTNIVLSDFAIPDAYFFAKIGRYFSVSKNVVLGFVSNNVDSTGVRMFSSVKATEWKRERYPFRKLTTPNFAIHSTLLSRTGKFETRLSSDPRSMMELGYRAYNKGSYFIPVDCEFSNQTGERALKKSDSSEKESTFVDLCPVNWWRKSDALHTIPKVSIYIPSYNNGRYIVQAIDSVLNQDFSDLEICICDDGSSDGTLDILARRYSLEPKVSWLAAENGGIGHSSNIATEMTRGLYVGQLDSDDLLKPGAIKRLAQYLDENPLVGCVYSSCERIDKDGAYIKDEYSFPVFSREKMMMTSIAHHFRMFRRQSWERTLKFRDDIMNAVDYDIFLKLSEVCRFHHIDEMYYQRRWHGNNTSFVNEGLQSNNTHVVLNNALGRLGLGNEWEVYAPDPVEPRKISYRRKHPVNRIFFWPDYSNANPYQKLLYGKLPENFALYSGDIDSAIKAASDKSQPGSVIFHLHWLNQFSKTAETKAQYVENTEQFLKKLSQFKKYGGKVVWTIHNVVSHDGGEAADWELEFVMQLLKVIDTVHVHSEKSLPEIERKYRIPREKLRFSAHGNYIGYYPNYISGPEARDRLGFSRNDIVFSFVGQVRVYKGLDLLLEAFMRLAQQDKRIKLVVAGKADFPLSENPFAKQMVMNGTMRISDGFVSDEDLQIFFNAANFSVFPYRNILTSGSVLLSLSFGVPVIAPRVGMTSEVITSGHNGILFDEPTVSCVFDALKQAVMLSDNAKDAQMMDASLNVARKYNWENVSSELYNFSK